MIEIITSLVVGYIIGYIIGYNISELNQVLTAKKEAEIATEEMHKAINEYDNNRSN